MAATLAYFGTTKPGLHITGDIRLCRAVLTPDTSYPTGGIDLQALASQIGLGHILQVAGSPVSRTGNRIGGYLPVTGKFAIYTALGTEAVNATDQSVNGIFDVLVWGT